MGIAGLLPFIKNSCRPANIRDFQGCTVAVDAYSWLHKGVFSCAEKIAKGEKTDGYIYYCLKQLNMLLDCGVKPIMVFDGCNLESKSLTEKKRRENREKTRQRGKEFLCEGKIKEARECFQRCVDVTPEMALEVIQACHKKKIDCIVAPYEADAQLAFLSQKGIAQIIITEDSDLVLFGCEKILFKMGNHGDGILYEKENLPKAFGNHAEKFSFEKFRYMCILSGCDYLPSLPGIGLAKAFKFFLLTNNPDLQNVLPKIPAYLRMTNLIVSPEYKEAFVKANNTFLYQLVFCPLEKSLMPLNPYPENVDPSEMEYAGKYFANDLAYQLATGNISVKELEKLKSSNAHFLTNLELPSNAGSLWRLNEKPSKGHSPPANKSYFKFKSISPKDRNSNNFKKRTFEQINAEIEQDEIFSSYCAKKSPIKKTKPNCDKIEFEDDTEEKLVSHPVFIPFRKTLTTDSLNVSKNYSTLRKIVRSRFFVNNDAQGKNEGSKAPWLDSIDSEYQDISAKQQTLASPVLRPSKDHDSGIVEDYNSSLLNDTNSKENVSSVPEISETLSVQQKDFDCEMLIDDERLGCHSESSSQDDDDALPCSAISEDSEMTDSYANEDTDLTQLPIERHKNPFACSTTNSPPSQSFKKFLFQTAKSAIKKTPVSRCRTLGLSKKQTPKSVKSIEDTLFNFKFTRLPKLAIT